MRADNMKKENKEMTVGETIDQIINNPIILINQFSKMVDNCKKVNDDLRVKLKNKQSEIDYLKGQLSVYQKFLNEKRV